MKKLSSKYGLKASLGSDFHAPVKVHNNLVKYNNWVNDCEPIWKNWGVE